MINRNAAVSDNALADADNNLRVGFESAVARFRPRQLAGLSASSIVPDMPQIDFATAADRRQCRRHPGRRTGDIQNMTRRATTCRQSHAYGGNRQGRALSGTGRFRA